MPCRYLRKDVDMQLEKLETKNYKARDNFETTAVQVLQVELSQQPEEGLVRTVIVDQGHGFFFSIVGNLKGKLFSTETFYSKLETTGMDRHWQLPALLMLLTDFICTVKKYSSLQFIKNKKAKIEKTNDHK